MTVNIDAASDIYYSSFKKNVFETLQFSTCFEGYGLYGDVNF